MKQADLLTATFRQLASAKAGVKGGLNSALHSKDGKEKAEHFRDQMRQISNNQSPATPKLDKSATEISTAPPVLDAAAILAELTGETKPKSFEKEAMEKEEDTPKSQGDGKQVAMQTNDWRDPNGFLSAVMSSLDKAQGATRGDKSAQPIPALHLESKADENKIASMGFVAETDVKNPDSDVSAVKHFTATIETIDAKAGPVTKPVIREQETHFEPVQQVTTLQKIVDRMASDLPAVTSPEGAGVAEAYSQDSAKTTESRPVRMMTLELDPPNLGSVTIKMRLAGDSVEVHLTADRLETTNLLRQERGALSDAMQSAGYSFDIAAIDHTRAQDANLNNGQSQQQSQQQQASSDQRGSMSSSNGSMANGESSGRSSGEGQGNARQNRQDHDQLQTPPERQQDQGGRSIRSSTVYL